LLDDYEPNRTKYLPRELKSNLHRVGKPIVADRAAGTFARDILSRLLIDLSWSSSRLEGNTYSRLDTQRLIEFAQVAEGVDARDVEKFVDLATGEFARLHEGNIARYHLRPSEYWTWSRATKPSQDT
jgi:hypothetical protein